MTTVIAVYAARGCVGRCDAHCHHAATAPACCACICGGRNHGGGLTRAIENNAARVGLEPADLRRFARARRLPPGSLFVCDALSPRARDEVASRRRELARAATARQRRDRAAAQLSLF